MAQYAIVSHNLNNDETNYHGPYGDADYQEIYDEIVNYFKKEAETTKDAYNCWVVELSLWPEGLSESSYEVLSDINEMYEESK